MLRGVSWHARRRARKRGRARADEGASSFVTLLVAGAVFLAAVASLLLASRDVGRRDPDARTPSNDVEAQSLAALIASSQGIGWGTDADGLARLGLAAPDGSLDAAHIEKLRGALFVSTDNGLVDYPDARASLGLAGSQDFHLRIYPVALPEIYKETRQGLRTAYIGDWAALAAITLAPGSSSELQIAAQTQLNLTMFAQTASERLALRTLDLAYNDKVHITTIAPTILVSTSTPPFTQTLLQAVNLPLIEGDVYPDVKAYLNANLASRLPEYEILVVGSGVDQSSMTSAEVKFAIRDWVRAGGMLIVMGSSALNYQWLEPLFSVGVRTANGAATAPDSSHPMLVTPHELQWTLYDAHNMGWDIKATGANAAYDSFSHVVIKGGKDIMAVSRDGAFGAGRIFLTTYLPREVAQSLGQPEAERFLDNILLYGERSDLYLEYGPEQPADGAVSVAVRDSTLADSRLGQIPMRIELHFWGSAS